MKYCKYCDTEKEPSEFYPLAHASQGVSNRCKKCASKYSLALYHRKRAPRDNSIWESSEWFNIHGYEGKYYINRQGQVYNRDKNRIIKGSSTGSRGYHTYNLSINGSSAKNVLTHVVLANLFISNPHNKPEVNHKNGIKSDFHLDNLEWVTRSENLIHAFKIGLTKSGGRHHCAKGILDTQTGIYYDCVRESAEAKEMNYQTLRSQLQGQVSNRSGLIYI